MHKVEDIQFYQKSKELVKQVYILTQELPQEEKYGLYTQMRRCAVSIPSNIAEGAGRNSSKEFAHFLSIAMGSCYELVTQLELCNELDFISKDKIFSVIETIQEIKKMMYSFTQKLHTR